jgi:hypothetical protein
MTWHIQYISDMKEKLPKTVFLFPPYHPSLSVAGEPSPNRTSLLQPPEYHFFQKLVLTHCLTNGDASDTASLIGSFREKPEEVAQLGN